MVTIWWVSSTIQHCYNNLDKVRDTYWQHDKKLLAADFN